MVTPSSKTKDNRTFTRDNLFDLTGKVALVTGGGSGIGLMATQALAANGAKVYITGRTQSKLDTVASTYGGSALPPSSSGSIHAIQGDVATKDGIRMLVDAVSQREPHLSILVNNAGVSSRSFQVESQGSAEEMKKNLFDNDNATFDDWDGTYSTNVTACYFTTMAFLPLLHASTAADPHWSATVLNVTSISGEIQVAQHHFAYNASKAAAIHLTRMSAAEIAASNNIKVRVNSIAPGVFPSEMTAKDSDVHQKSAIEREKYQNKVPAGRPGRDEDMAQAVLFAVCNQYLNGQTVTVDGGYTLAAGR